MRKCKYGHKHCCHKIKREENMYDVTDSGRIFYFTRIYCAVCNTRLSDVILGFL
jgi:hypothetical protein